MIDPLIIFIVLFFVFGLPIIFMIYYFKRIEKRPAGTNKNSEIVREREVIVKEIVMIPCQYCGGIMPQTSIFCPNCGAKKKRKKGVSNLTNPLQRQAIFKSVERRVMVRQSDSQAKDQQVNTPFEHDSRAHKESGFFAPKQEEVVKKYHLEEVFDC